MTTGNRSGRQEGSAGVFIGVLVLSDPRIPMASVSPDAPEGEKMDRALGAVRPLPNQPGLTDCTEGQSICKHKGTTAYPAHQGMLDAGAVSGVYDCPACPKPCTLYIGAVPAVGFLCMCQRVAGCPIACWIAPFNCLPGGGLGTGGTPIDVLYLPTSKCLPSWATLAATWFCACGSCSCYDYHNTDTLLSTCCCCLAPQVHTKLSQGTIIF